MCARTDSGTLEDQTRRAYAALLERARTLGTEVVEGARVVEVDRTATGATVRTIDGRAFSEVRPIWGEVGVLSRTHGSAIFTRGETQALAVTTLGTPSDEQRIETLLGETFKSFMLHYNFPPYSVGETRRLGVALA